MEQYFSDVVSNLSIDDMNVLGILYDHESTATFKAMRNSELQEISALSESIFRKIIYRLTASKFITSVTLEKQHRFFITEYGIAALKASLKEVSA